jgi:ABC-type multidrug transport system, permease component
MNRFISNPFLLVMTFLVPILLFVILGNALGGTMSHLPVGVVQEGPPYENTPLFTRATYELNQVPPTDPDLPNVNKQLDVTIYSDEALAKQDLLEGKLAAVVVFPSAVSNDHAIRLYMDSSDRQRPPQILAAVKSVLLEIGAHNPVVVDQVYGDIRFIQYFGLGLAMMIIFTAGLASGGSTLVRDRETGIHEDDPAKPHSPFSIITGTLASSTIRGFIAGLIIVLLVLLTDLPYPPDPPAFLLALLVLLISSIAITSMIIFVAAWIPIPPLFSAVMPIVSICLYMSSGAIFPLISMPDWLRTIALINPESYGTEALRGVILRNQGFNVIGTDLILLLVFSAVMIVLAIITFRRTLK